jgi:UDPglucose 6-dehydrogenase
MKVAIIGTGYVGTVTAACLASLGHEAVGIDVQRDRVDALQAGLLPFVEPDLAPLVGQGLETGRLSFTDDYADALAGARCVFICVGTPLLPSGDPDLSYLQSAAESLGRHLEDGCVVVNKSTVPVGSGDWVRMLVEDTSTPDSPLREFHVVSNPEFLREGSAVEDFFHPDRIVLGGDGERAREVLEELYAPIVDQSFPGGRPEIAPVPVVHTTVQSAEMIKYAANAFLATKISFINEMANICEKVGADVVEVARGIGLDRRIGQAFLNAGLGWGGSCFQKDIAALQRTGEEYGYTAEILSAITEINRRQRLTVVQKLQGELKILKGKRIVLLGLAFKPQTDDLRDAPSLTIAARLHAAGCKVLATDPVVKWLPPDLDGKIEIFTDPLDALRGADAAVLVTEWPEFVNLDLCEVAEIMRTPVLVDGRNALSKERAEAAGLRYLGIGR